jgi:hypothetical protein
MGKYRFRHILHLPTVSNPNISPDIKVIGEVSVFGFGFDYDSLSLLLIYGRLRSMKVW